MEVSCAFPTTLDSPQHAAVAEELGYKHAWFYDNAPLSPDVWMMLALAAEATSRIGLGPGALNPGLRHPMVNAAGTAALAALAPGRVAVAFGTGFGMRVLGRLTVPVQVHHGTEDRLMPFAAGRELARRIPGAQFVVHDGAGHALVLERAEESAERILAFLAECEAERRHARKGSFSGTR